MYTEESNTTATTNDGTSAVSKISTPFTTALFPLRIIINAPNRYLHKLETMAVSGKPIEAAPSHFRNRVAGANFHPNLNPL